MNNPARDAQFPGRLPGKRNDQACKRSVRLAASRTLYVPGANIAIYRFLNLAIISSLSFKQ
jgi:hypothetical protein